jgi:soluble lytic murein transglycosylase-like protein
VRRRATAAAAALLVGLAAPGAAGAAVRYTVHVGDTLSGIAARNGTSVAALARANGLDPAGILPVGRRLVLPAAGAAVAASVTAPWSVGVAIDRWSLHYGVDPHLARALAWMESGWQEDAVSSAGARGIMQVTPETWRYVERILIGVPVAHTADGNIRIGVAYLHHLLNEFGGDERLALAAYYQGASAVRRYGVLPQSRAYVADVLAIRQRM